MATGKIKFFDTRKAFGFIVPDEGGSDVFVHVSAVAPSSPPLVEGMRVMFEVEADRRSGKTKAANVRPAGNDGR